MFREYKYSVWAIAVKLVIVYVTSTIINLLVVFSLMGIFSESVAWAWFMQAVALFIHLGLMFMFVAADGRRDILVDSANKKRAERYEDFKYELKFDKRKGFIAGLILQVPIVVSFIILAASGYELFALDVFVRISLTSYVQFMKTMGLSAFSLIFFIALYSGFAGLGYISALSHQKKIHTIIKRNEEKATAKGIIKKEK